MLAEIERGTFTNSPVLTDGGGLKLRRRLLGILAD